ncbi:MAG TPA: zf-HC2 domain-containing protein [Rugosimonospora sp.]|nr:zf-HC2 domain-containing protein [Rugosimonospora sp.]
MDDRPDCAGVRPLLAELATGALTGYARAQVLRHVSGCAACRAELAELSRVADELLLLAPSREPRAGFESAVLERLHTAGARRRPRLGRTAVRRLVAAAAVVVALLVGVAVEDWRTAPDRRLADQYRQILAWPGRAAPVSAAVLTPGGAVAGTVYLYPGSPPWVMVAVTAAPQPGDYTMDVVTAAGARYPVGICTVSGRTGTIGYSLPVPITQLRTIELSRPGLRLTVHLG